MKIQSNKNSKNFFFSSFVGLFCMLFAAVVMTRWREREREKGLTERMPKGREIGEEDVKETR